MCFFNAHSIAQLAGRSDPIRTTVAVLDDVEIQVLLVVTAVVYVLVVLTLALFFYLAAMIRIRKRFRACPFLRQ